MGNADERQGNADEREGNLDDVEAHGNLDSASESSTDRASDEADEVEAHQLSELPPNE